MMLGIPVVGLATTELATIIENGKSGYVHTNVAYLAGKMKLLLNDPGHATRLGEAGRETALKKFDINRFTSEWEQLFRMAVNDNKNLITQVIYE
jgi:glycosyltransferase involved in cell wall biosynthesis